MAQFWPFVIHAGCVDIWKLTILSPLPGRAGRALRNPALRSRKGHLWWGLGRLGLRHSDGQYFLSLTNLVERVRSSFWFNYEIPAGALLLHLASGESMARKVLPFPESFAQMRGTTATGLAGGTHAIMDLTGHTPFGFP